MKPETVVDLLFDSAQLRKLDAGIGALTGDLKPLAKAIICGEKCKDLGLQSIQAPVKGLMKKMLVYYGSNYNDDSAEFMLVVAAKEILNWYPQLTIEEIIIGSEWAAHQRFGDVFPPKYKFNLAFFNTLLKKYVDSDQRKSIIHACNRLNEYLSAKPLESQTAQNTEQLVEWVVDQFKRYKQWRADMGTDKANKAAEPLLSSVHYQVLLDAGHTLPDWRMCEFEARLCIKELKRAEDITPELLMEYAGPLKAHAKRITLTKLFDELIAQGKSLQEYIQSNQLTTA